MTGNDRPQAFHIDPAIFGLYPQLLVGIVLAFGISNRAGDAYDEPIETAIRAEEARILRELEGTKAAHHPAIAPWQEAYRAFRANPKKYPSSIENLLGRVLRGNPIRHINRLVDIYNAISLRYLLPVGGEDLDTVKGDIRLAVATEGEAPVALLGEDEARSPQIGEVIYKDDAGAICRRFNWKEAERTKLTESTTNAILVIESLPPAPQGLIEQAIADLSAMIRQFCGGRIETEILDSAKPSTSINY